jgi:iduronate 2-sulfatase
MKPLLLALTVALAAVQVATAADRLNVLFIAIDDLRNDLGCLGAVHARTPRLDAFATTARPFSHHYTQVPTCGASRSSLLHGRYPIRRADLGNEAIRATHKEWAAVSLPGWFRQHGYHTLALGKITHYPGGRTGRLWEEGPEELPGVWDRSWIPTTPWGAALHMMHGYANGVPRTSGKSPPLEAFDGPDDAYPDAWIASDAIRTLRGLAESEKPWFFAVGFFKPHLPFAAPKKWFDLHEPEKIPAPASPNRPPEPSGWHNSGEFRGNYGHNGRDPAKDPEYARLLRHAYAASISYVDAQVGRVLETLEALDLEKSTVIVVWGDHGFLLGEHAIWGKHCLYEEALRAPLIIRHPGMKNPGRLSRAIVESVDLFPTLLDLCGLPSPDGLSGQSLRPQLADAAATSSKPALGFWTNGQRTLRTERWRLIVHPEKGEAGMPGIELFDYENDPAESRNHAAEHPAIVKELLGRLETHQIR